MDVRKEHFLLTRVRRLSECYFTHYLVLVCKMPNITLSPQIKWCITWARSYLISQVSNCPRCLNSRSERRSGNWDHLNVNSTDKPDIYQPSFQNCQKQFSKGHLAPADYHHKKTCYRYEIDGVEGLPDWLLGVCDITDAWLFSSMPPQLSSSSVSSSFTRTPWCRSSPCLRAQEWPSVYGGTRKGKNSV